MTLVAWRTRGVLIIVLALTAMAVSAPASLADEPSPMVIMIGVEGNKAVPSEEILTAVKSTQIGSQLNLDAIRVDNAAIYDLGYFSEVLPPEFRRVLGGVKVVFRVVEYPPLKEIKINGLTKMPAKEALPVFTTKPGQVINRNTIAKDLRQLFEKAQNDYGLILKSPAQNISADGVVEIDLIEIRLRNLSFVGLDKTKEYVVRREISAQEGEIFDLKAFTKDLQNLFMMGYFESIDPKFTETGERDRLDVRIEFKEAKTGTISLSLTYSTQDEEWMGGFKVGDSNAFGTGNRVSVSVEMNPDKRNLDLSFTDPWIDAKHTSLTLHLYNNFDSRVLTVGAADQDVLAQETLQGWEIGLGRPLTKKLTASVTGRHEYLERVATVDPYILQPGEVRPANPPPLTPSLVTNSLTLQLEYKNLTPQKAKYVYVADGIRAKASTEFAGGILGGDVDFTRYQIESAFFKSVSPRDVFALRLKGGYVDAPAGGDPLGTADFIIGGAETLRGYDYRDFSATQMALANLEYRHRFTDSLEGVVFYDTGVFYSADEGWQNGSGYGLGIRIWVPYLGQIRLDYGWPQEDSGEGQLYFSIGEVF